MMHGPTLTATLRWPILPSCPFLELHALRASAVASVGSRYPWSKPGALVEHDLGVDCFSCILFVEQV